MSDIETNSDKFKRLANSRLSKAIDSISLLEPLSVTATYEYDDEAVKIIMEELEDAVARVKEAFKNGGPVVKTRKFF